jgi:hypothetical protein
MGKRYFTSQEVKELVWDNEIETTYGENRRWSRSASSIVEADDGKFYRVYWENGLTESQPNEFFNDTYDEVEQKTYEKTIAVTEWIEVE